MTIRPTLATIVLTFLFLVFAFAQTTPEQSTSGAVTPEEILATQAAIRKQGPRVPHDTYKKIVPAYVDKRGELTEEGEAIIGGGKSTTFEITVEGSPVKITRIGTGPVGVIFFGHSGSKQMVKYLKENVGVMGDLLPEKCSFFVWEYPTTAPFDKVQQTVQTYAQTPEAYSKADPGLRLALPGIATSVISQIQQKSELKEYLIVGNSLGAGLVLWDFDKLVKDPSLTFLLISPTESFMPPTDKIPTLERTVMIGSKGSETGDGDLRFSTDRFLKGMDEKSEAKAWHWFRTNNNEEWGDLITASRASEPTKWETRPDGSKYHMALPTDFEIGHKTIGGEISAELLTKLIRVKLGWSDKAILAEPPGATP